ncbi:helix-turn-helix domain-containing protein [Shewanella sp. FeAMO]
MEMPNTLVHKWGRNALDAGWTVIPNKLLKKQTDLKLTNSELIMLIHIISFYHEHDSVIFPSIKTLSALTGQHERTTQRTINRLVNKGVLEKKIRALKVTDLGLTNLYDLTPLKKKLSKL